MSPYALNELPQSYPSHNDDLIGDRIMAEARQRELDHLVQLTGEILINEYRVMVPNQESVA